MSFACGKQLSCRHDSCHTPTLAIFSTHLAVRSSNTGVGQIVYAGSGSSLTWSPDRTRIAFEKSSTGLAVVPSGGGTVISLPGTSTASKVEWQL